MKDIIIQKLRDKIQDMQNKAADAFIADQLSDSPTLEEVAKILSDISSGDIEVK
jgi:hypothetical protein